MAECVFEAVPGSVADYRCTRCARLVLDVGALPIHAHCRAGGPPPPSPPKRQRVPFAGPGRELTRLIHAAGLKESSRCQCEARAQQMNEWGVVGCRARVPEIAGWLRDSYEKLGWREKLSAAAALAGKLDWLRPVESLVELAIASAEQKTLGVLVLGHERVALNRVPLARHLQRVDLTEIESDNRLAESRIFLDARFSLFGSPPEYLGLATANWNRKYGPAELWHGRKWPHCLPLERLDELDLGEQHVVHCAAIADEHWAAALDELFPGCDALVDELIAHFGLRLKKCSGPLANNFIAHRDVALDHARFMREAIEHLDVRYGRDWPISGERLPCFAERLPAFACECASILYFANRPDLELRQIPPPK